MSSETTAGKGASTAGLTTAFDGAFVTTAIFVLLLAALGAAGTDCCANTGEATIVKRTALDTKCNFFDILLNLKKVQRTAVAVGATGTLLVMEGGIPLKGEA